MKSMADCVFCKIVAGELPAKKIWEDEDFEAILDIFPKIPGQVLVISKRHVQSDIFKLKDEDVCKFFSAAKTTAAIMEKALGTARTSQRMEGLEVDHAHIKLYPVYSVEDYENKSNLPPKRITDELLNELFIKFQKGR